MAMGGTELFKLFGTIGLDGVEKTNKEINDVTKKANDAYGKIGKTFGTIGKTIAVGITAGVTAAGTALGKIVKDSVSAFADYEQVAGGAKLMFGDAYSFIAEKAANAYSTVQMSQNDYLTQVNGFATGLKTALGGNEQAAAELADKIINAEADIVAATGNTQENVQNAFNGIMKSNFTMLDNLQIGITPTKEGFQQVIDKVNEWNTTNGHATKYQIDNLADCQKALVDYIEMQGLSGYAAKEASGTISGSLAMTKSAWQNLMSGLAQDNADIPTLVNNVVTSGAKVLENIIPRVKEVLKNIPAAISEISPEAGAAFQTVIDVIMAVLPVLKDALVTAFDVIKNTINFVREHTGALTAVATAIGVIVTAIGMYNAVAAIKAAMAAAEVTTVWGLVAAYAAQAAAMVVALAPYLAIAAAIAAVIAVGVLLVKNWDTIKAKVKEVWNSIKTTISNVLNNIKTGISNAWNSIKTATSNVWNAIKNFFVNTWNSVKTVFTNALNSVKTFISNTWNAIKTTTSNVWNSVKTFFTNLWNSIKTIVTNAINSVKTTITNVFNSIKTTITNIWNSIKNFFVNTWNSIKTSVSNAINNVKNTVINVFTSVKTKVANIWNGIRDAIMKPIETAKNKVKSVIDSIKGFFNFKFQWPKIKLPHFGITPKGWKIGDLLNGSIPKLGIDWYAKGAILDKPTVFGVNGSNLMVGGEAGKEAVAPIDTLQTYVKDAVRSEMGLMESYLMRLVETVDEYLPKAAEGKNLVLDSGALVGAMAGNIDYTMGNINRRKERWG